MAGGAMGGEKGVNVQRSTVKEAISDQRDQKQGLL